MDFRKVFDSIPEQGLFILSDMIVFKIYEQELVGGY